MSRILTQFELSKQRQKPLKTRVVKAFPKVSEVFMMRFEEFLQKRKICRAIILGVETERRDEFEF